MKRSLSLLLTLLFPLFIPHLAFAAGVVVGQGGTPFSPPDTDLSVIYLSNIFGVVDGVLHGSGSQILGAMFGIFNAAVLTIGGAIIAYVLCISTMNTAHEGKALGQKWNSLWVPIRSVVAVALLVPKATGYCALQIIVMWVVVQGVGAADAVAGAAINYLARGGVLIQANPPPDTGIIGVAGNIFKSEVCMYGLENSLKQHISGVNIPSFSASLVPIGSYTGQSPPIYTGTTTDGGATIFFPGNVNVPLGPPPANGSQGLSVNVKGICGSVAWNFSQDYTGNSSGNPAVSNPSGGAGDSRSIAMQQIVLDLQPLAQTVASYLVPQQNLQTVAPPGALKTTLTGAQDQLAFAAADYKGIMLPYLSQGKDAFEQAALKTITDNAKQGWIVLGGFYYELATLNNNTNATENAIPTYVGPQNKAKSDNTLWNNFSYTDLNAVNGIAASQGDPNSLDQAVFTNVSGGTSANTIDNYIYGEIERGGPQGYYKNTEGAAAKYAIWSVFSGLQAGSPALDFLFPGLGEVVSGFVGIVEHLASLADAQNLNADPIVTVGALGTATLTLVTGVWMLGIGLFGGVSLIGAVPCINSLGLGALSALMWMIPLVSALTVALFGAGALMAYYVPLIPFILFVFGGIGWMIAVIESMVAAPIVALGLADPGGQHEHFGRSEQALLLLLNIFMRPSMMVIGFFAGAILSHVGLWLLNQGFGHAWGSIMATNLVLSPGIGIVWGVVASLLIYVGFVLAIINKSFALIYEIPDKVTRWIGHHEQLGSGAAQGEQDVRGGFTSGAGTVGKAAGDSTQPSRQQEQVSTAMGNRAEADKKAAAAEVEGSSASVSSTPSGPPGTS